MTARAPALLLFAAALAVAGAPVADPLPSAASREPLEMSAEHLDLDVEAKTALLTGGVKLVKGPLTVACPRVEVRDDQVPPVTWARGPAGAVAAVKGWRPRAPPAPAPMPPPPAPPGSEKGE